MMRKVKFDFDPFDIAKVDKRKIPSEVKQLIIEDVVDLIQDKVLTYVADQTSPVSGVGSFKKLSKEYSVIKSKEVGNTKANLEAQGDMLDSLSVSQLKGTKIRLTVADDQQDKADGHNNFSGQSMLPRRPFIPDERRGETFKKEILDGIKKTVKNILEDFEK